jgi:hypothetical protein
MQAIPNFLDRDIYIKDVVKSRRKVVYYNETTTLRARVYFTFHNFNDRRTYPDYWVVPLEEDYLDKSVKTICEELEDMGWETKHDKERNVLFIYLDMKTKCKMENFTFEVPEEGHSTDNVQKIEEEIEEEEQDMYAKPVLGSKFSKYSFRGR